MAKITTTNRSVLIVNGPNLNLLGTREPHIYGSTTLTSLISDLDSYIGDFSKRRQIERPVLQSFQSNHEGAILDRLHEARGNVDMIIINPGGLTHTSVVLRDALTGIDIPFIEVHISNVHAREAFRHHSFLSEKAVAVIAGLGVLGYKSAIDFYLDNLKRD